MIPQRNAIYFSDSVKEGDKSTVIKWTPGSNIKDVIEEDGIGYIFVEGEKKYLHDGDYIVVKS